MRLRRLRTAIAGSGFREYLDLLALILLCGVLVCGV